MRVSLLLTGIFLFVLAFAVPGESYAGGCSRGGGGGGGSRGAPIEESPAERKRRLAQAFELGKRILEGKVTIRPRVPNLVRQHEEVLAEFKKRAPNEKIDDVVGRLSREELDAVKHYLTTKYPASPLSAEHIRVARFLKEKALIEN